jgi:hypothetical protein
LLGRGRWSKSNWAAIPEVFHLRHLAAIAVSGLFAASGIVHPIQAESSSLTRAAADRDGPARTCTGMDGRSFEWRWSNAPFASSCTPSPGTTAIMEPKAKACHRDCEDISVACFTAVADVVPTNACFDKLIACKTTCAAVQVSK